MNTPTEEEMRALCKAAGGTLTVVRHPQVDPLNALWVCTIDIGAVGADIWGAAVTKELAIQSAWEKYVNHIGDKSSS